MSVIKFDRDFSTLFNWDTDENPTTEQDYQNAVKNWTETEMNIVDTLLWQPTTEYTTGNIVKTPSLPSQYVLRCAEAGTSGSTEPSYSGASVGDTVTDGTVEWVIVSLATGNAADVDASNIGVNAEVDNSEAWGNAIGGGAIAEDDGRLVTGDTVHTVTSVMETNIATNTEAIEDNAEAIATNTETIAQHTTDIDIADKRISNIEKLLQGNLYDYQTDSTSAYTKTVLAGAMPYASLDSIGGKTLVWNQLSPDSMIDTFSGVCTSPSGGYYYKDISNFNTITAPIVGHKYYCKVNATSDTASYYGIRLYYGHGAYVLNDNGSTITTAENTVAAFRYMSTNNTDTVTVTVDSLMVIDLTILYGAGNEPTTVAEFQAMFPASYYPYNAGTLLSAGVTEVVSKGKNLFDNTQFAEHGAYRGYTVNPYGETMTMSISDNDTSVSIAGMFLGWFNADYNGSGTLVWLVVNGNINFPSKYVSSTLPNVAIYPKTAETLTALMQRFNIQIEYGSTATSYTPYKAPIQYPIPAEIQALEGYGWSAGSVYNYIDYERKVFVQCVGRLHYDSTGWTLRNTQDNGMKTYSRQETSVTNFAAGYISNVVKGKVTAYVVGYIGGVTWMYDLGACMAVLSGGNYVYLNTTDISNTDLNIYYVLATPIETDISAYITDDNLIEVEAGGSLTFPNSNGTDYQIPVPSAETYMVDLQASL